jgi:hypothetical protein
MSLDDYEPAIDATDAASDTGDAIGDASTAPVEVREVVRDRGVKETTRKLFADAAAKLKPQLEAGEGDELEVAITDDPPAAAAVASSASPASTANPPAAAAPAPDPVAQAVDTRATAQLELERKAFDDERQAFDKLREEWSAKFDIRDRYAEDPAGAIVSLLKEWTGAATDDELKDEVSDLITMLSGTTLGAPVPESHKIRISSKQALRQVKAYKADQAKRDAEQQKRAEAEQQKYQERQAITTLSRELDAAKDKFPYLAAEDDPGGVVWEVIKTKHQQTGAVPSWEECARLADEHFKKKTEAWAAKRRHLLAPAAPQAPVVASAPQGDPQSRRSSTLTNKTAAPVSPASSSDEDVVDRDAHRRRSLSNLRGRMKESTT